MLGGQSSVANFAAGSLCRREGVLRVSIFGNLWERDAGKMQPYGLE